MYESPKKGLRMLIIMIIGSILLNISPRLFLANTRTYYEMMRQPSLWHARRSFYLYHQNIIQYLGSFSIGLLLGYAIIVNDNISKDPKSNNHHRQQRKIIIYNGLAIIGLFMPFIWVNQFFGQDDSPNELSVLFFFSIGRFIFGLSFGWIIYASVANKSRKYNTHAMTDVITITIRYNCSIHLQMFDTIVNSTDCKIVVCYISGTAIGSISTNVFTQRNLCDDISKNGKL